MAIEHELVIAAPVAVVWRLTEDISSWPKFTPTITEVERLDDGPLHVGSQARVKQPRQRARVWTVTRLEPNEAFEWGTKVFGVQMTALHHLADADGGCRNTLTVTMSGTASGLLGKLLGGPIRKAITTENEGFKRAAESAS